MPVIMAISIVATIVRFLLGEFRALRRARFEIRPFRALARASRRGRRCEAARLSTLYDQLHRALTTVSISHAITRSLEPSERAARSHVSNFCSVASAGTMPFHRPEAIQAMNMSAAGKM